MLVETEEQQGEDGTMKVNLNNLTRNACTHILPRAGQPMRGGYLCGVPAPSFAARAQ